MTRDEPPAPPHIPDYELLSCIGRGSYGVVWIARSVTGLYRAVKIVWRAAFEDAQPYEREFRGIKEFAAVSLVEPRQLALLHVGRNDAAGFFYYVMELADDVVTGRDIDPDRYMPFTLRELRANRGRLPADEALTLAVDLAGALAGLHAHQLVHRDIKPSNIIFVGGVPKLADIGLVTAAANGELTVSRVGNLGYMPPDLPGSPSADVYGLGKVLYEIATGRSRDDYPRLPADLDQLPDRKGLLELNEIFIRACAPNAEKRYPSAAALRDDLLLLQAGKSVRRLRQAERRTARALRIAALLALIASIAGVGAWVERRRADDERTQRELAQQERDRTVRMAAYGGYLTQAQRAVEQIDLGRARQLLRTARPNAASPARPGFEWHALWHEAQADPAMVLREEGSPGQAIRYHPASGMLALQTADRETQLWHVATGQPAARLSGMRQLAGFSPDGKSLFGVNARSRLQRWNTTGEPMESPEAFRATWPLGSLGSGRWLAYAQVPQNGQPHLLNCCDFETGSVAWSLPVPFTGLADDAVYYAGALSPDGKSCALSLISQRAQRATWRLVVFSLPDGRVQWSELLDHRITALAFTADSRRLAAFLDDSGELKLLDLPAQRWSWSVPLPINRVSVLACNADDLIAAGGRSGRLLLLDARDGALRAERRGHEIDVQAVEFLSGTRLVANTGSGGDLRVWSLEEAAPQQAIAGFWNPPGGGRAVCVSDDGNLFAATVAADRSRVVSVTSGRTIADLPDVAAPICFSREGDAVWVASTRQTLELRKLASPALPSRELPMAVDQLLTAASSADLSRLACIDNRGALIFTDLVQGTVSPALNSQHGYPWWVALSPDGRLAATGGRDETVRIWDVAEQKPRTSWRRIGSIVNGAFSPDGGTLVLVRSSGSIEARSPVTGALFARVVTSSGILQGITFSPTEPRLFLGGRNGTVHVIDTSRWEEVTQLHAVIGDTRQGSMARIAVDAAGRTLAGYTEFGTVRLWRSVP